MVISINLSSSNCRYAGMNTGHNRLIFDLKIVIVLKKSSFLGENSQLDFKKVKILASDYVILNVDIQWKVGRYFHQT